AEVWALVLAVSHGDLRTPPAERTDRLDDEQNRPAERHGDDRADELVPAAGPEDAAQVRLKQHEQADGEVDVEPGHCAAFRRCSSSSRPRVSSTHSGSETTVSSSPGS